jgi:hypothetical protein
MKLAAVIFLAQILAFTVLFMVNPEMKDRVTQCAEIVGQ